MMVLLLLIGRMQDTSRAYLWRRNRAGVATLPVLINLILGNLWCWIFFNYAVVSSLVFNFVMIGRAFSAVFFIMMSKMMLKQIVGSFNPL